MRMAIAAALVAATAVAHADDHVSGFVASGSGPLIGHVVDDHGRTVGGAEVHVVSRSGGEQIVKTDPRGNYRVTLRAAPGEPSMVFVNRTDQHVTGQVGEATRVGDEEVIEMHEMLPAAKQARPLAPARVPDYTDAAIDADAWSRVWMLLDIDEHGAVVRVKYLSRAGYGLDTVALHEAFGLRFEPARDLGDRPMESMVIYGFEWPSYAWQIAQHVGMHYLSADVEKVRCARPGVHTAWMRDCTQPDPGRAFVEAWVEPRRH
ncbi:MAG TPA: carboxypeptidase-like regulatory domain-containing protein [Kofleriaceae bacterium]|jgi:hypothetical protein